MAAVNYNHLWYFWMVAREGSIAAATGRLGVTQPAISSQIARLERSLGVKLFEKSGRGLALTPAGATVYAYADEIFALGREMLETLERGGRRPLRMAVGVAEGVPPALTHRLLAPALGLPRPVRLEVRHASLPRLTAELAARELDLVLCAERLPAGAAVRARPHPLGECGMVLLAVPEMAVALAPGFPTSLDGMPFVMPPSGAPGRRVLDAWLQAVGVAPAVLAEMDDWAASLLLAQSGAGVIAVPAAGEAELRQRYGLEPVGDAPDAVQHFFALTAERRPRHPGLVAVLEAARADPIR
jgi:LysR family transcriptional regulator, transcriptional activator of nhaA